jgi:hypothetical protein
VASLAERPPSAAPQSSSAPQLSTDRIAAQTPSAPPASTTATIWPDEDYRGWASL